MNKKLSVFTFFAYINDKKDPYLSKLYGALEKRGVKSYDMENPLKVFGADIIHLHWIEYYFTSKKKSLIFLKWLIFPIIFLILRYILRKKIIITLHNIDLQEENYPIIERIGFRFYLKYIANKIIVFNNYTKGKAEKRYGVDEAKMIKTAPFSYTNYYKNTITKKEARKKLGIPDKKLVFLVFGRLWEYKGVYDMINFLKKEKSRDYVVIFAGRPENKDVEDKLLELKKEQGDKIILKLGFVKDDDVQVYVNACDAGLLPYRKASASGPVVIFGCFKKTSVARDVGSFRETMGKAGVYYDDDKGLKQKLDHIDANELKQKGKQLYSSVKNITWENIAKDTLDIYNG